MTMEPVRMELKTPTAEQHDPVVREVPVKWVEPETPVVFANFVSGIVDGLGDIIMSIGQLEPPLIVGATEEERIRAIEQVESVQGRILMRFSVSPERLRDMVERINQVLEVRENWKRDILKLGERKPDA
jgi:hypothetical protein